MKLKAPAKPAPVKSPNKSPHSSSVASSKRETHNAHTHKVQSGLASFASKQ